MVGCKMVRVVCERSKDEAQGPQLRVSFPGPLHGLPGMPEIAYGDHCSLAAATCARCWSVTTVSDEGLAVGRPRRAVAVARSNVT